ncbi:response regulator transcription factor [Parapedobacter tibetensis]|uniref:response regulator transcription factor n=1 Tax=Parapedobacter tibetensis TaxID=2972951 RepID=UPI00214D319F|nr:response regulator transcription factor [Parapedobacter tibetensis]
MTENNISQITVGIIDNQTPINRYTAEYLNAQPNGITVIFTAKNGLEMQDQIHRYGAPHVMIMDIRMPHMNGYEATKWLAKHFPETHVLVYTFSEEKAAVQGMLRSGARGFIAKASDTDDLATAIHHLYKSGRYVNALVTERDLSLAEQGKLGRGIADIPAKRMNVLHLLSEGYSQKEIAAKNSISIYTVRGHVKHLRNTFGVQDNTALIARAHECGLVPLKKAK